MALGTVAELAVGVALGKTPPDLLKRARALLGRLGLEIDLAPAELVASFPHLARDKKRVKDGFKLPLVSAPGRTQVEYVTRATLESALRAQIV